MSTVSQLSTNYTKLSDSRRSSEVPNAALEMNINRPRGVRISLGLFSLKQVF